MIICINVRVNGHIMIKEPKEQSEAVVKQMKEIYGENTNVSVYNRPKKIKGIPDFTMLFQGITFPLTRIMTPAACKLLLYFLSKTQWDNFIGCNVKTMSEDLNLTERTIIKSTKELKQLSVIISIKDDDDKRRNVYMINPHQSWKGTYTKRKKILKDNTAQLKLNFDGNG